MPGLRSDEGCRLRFEQNPGLCHNTGHQPGKYEQNGWVYRKDTSDGRCGVFSRRRPRRPREPAEVYDYSDTQRTARFVYPDGSKKVLPQYWDGEECRRSPARIQPSANKWPMYCESRVLGQSTVIELEGEKCTNIARADGLVGAACQPGFAHKPEQVAERYQRLKEAGAELVVIVADHDVTGHKRAQQSALAASMVDLDFLILQAEQVWPGIPRAAPMTTPLAWVLNDLATARCHREGSLGSRTTGRVPKTALRPP